LYKVPKAKIIGRIKATYECHGCRLDLALKDDNYALDNLYNVGKLLVRDKSDIAMTAKVFVLDDSEYDCEILSGRGYHDYTYFDDEIFVSLLDQASELQDDGYIHYDFEKVTDRLYDLYDTDYTSRIRSVAILFKELLKAGPPQILKITAGITY
jgi:hypothetical protein